MVNAVGMAMLLQMLVLQLGPAFAQVYKLDFALLGRLVAVSFFAAALLWVLGIPTLEVLIFRTLDGIALSLAEHDVSVWLFTTL